MPNELTLRVTPEVAAKSELLRKETENVLRGQGFPITEDILGLYVRKRSIDARGKKLMMQLQVQVFGAGEEAKWDVLQRVFAEPKAVYLQDYLNVRDAEKVHIVGAMPGLLYPRPWMVNSWQKRWRCRCDGSRRSGRLKLLI